jgi:hypothetical protein
MTRKMHGMIFIVVTGSNSLGPDQSELGMSRSRPSLKRPVSLAGRDGSVAGA